MSDRPPPRRPAFDEITMGWGSDTESDLAARIDLTEEWLAQNRMGAGIPMAEQRVMNAMQVRLLRYYREGRA